MRIPFLISILVPLVVAIVPSLPAQAGERHSTTRTLAPLKGVRRIVFLGDSITYAGGYVEAIEAYLRTQTVHGKIELIDVGLPSENVSGLTEPDHAGGAFPRPDLHERLDRVLAKTKPDLVVACYGMNDGIYYPFDEARFRKFREGIEWMTARVEKVGARIWLVTPPPFDAHPVRKDTLPEGRAEYPSGHPYVGYDDVLGRYSEWLLLRRAEGRHVIDIHSPINAYVAERRRTVADFGLSGDGVHLNDLGHRLIAREILLAWGAPSETLPALDEGGNVPADDARGRFTSLIHERQRLLTDAWLTTTGHKRPGLPVGEPIAIAKAKAADLDRRIREAAATMPPQFPGARGDYHGFARFDFHVDGCNATVVTPRSAASGLPWIWRAEFFDHRPELDLALLARGFHLVFIEVGNTFGAPSAMKHWDAFYDLLTRDYGLSPKPVLEGLSRGGLYVYNWAAANPTKVSVLYGDNPVCDFKSWPGGKGKGPGSPDDWRKLQQDYGFHSEAEALAYGKNPVDNLASLAKARVPIIHVCGDADEVVPFPENTLLLKERYGKLGGKVEMIVKPGGHHHPHGLDDPTPLVRFILAHTRP